MCINNLWAPGSLVNRSDREGNSGRAALYCDGRLASFLTVLTPDLLPVFEFRHSSWFDEEVFDLLRRHRSAFCVSDMPGMPCPMEVTADFAYLRFHGTGQRYGGSYSEAALLSWAQKISSLAERVRAIYVYFNNDIGGYTVKNAMTLLHFLRKVRGQ